MIRLYWLSADGQADLPMGSWPDDWQGDREEWQAAAERDALSQCGSEREREMILAGSWHWYDDEDQEG